MEDCGEGQEDKCVIRPRTTDHRQFAADYLIIIDITLQTA
jgi:hypothetical protein